MVQAFPVTGHPMQALQASLAALGMVSPKVDLRDAASKDEAMAADATMLVDPVAHRPSSTPDWQAERARVQPTAPTIRRC